jgi:hypothetical protein
MDHQVMVVRPGHFAVYGSEGGKAGGKANLGKPQRVNTKGGKPASSHPGVHYQLDKQQ